MRLPSPDLSYSASIHHDGSSRYVRTPANDSPGLGDVVEIRLRAGLGAPLERVLLRTFPDGEQKFTALERMEDGPACQWWQASLHLTMPLTHYRFLLFAPHGAWWYNGSGLHENIPTDAEDFRILAGYSAPTWVYDSVFYQIFPDRFMDGDPSNNVRSDEFTYWGEPARARRWGEHPSQGRAAMVEFYGGDLQGITQRLDHLEALGVNSIYLNPIFPALSNHRYDVIDYQQVDPHLGGDDALAELRKATCQRGMHIILDIVPNHCGFFHPWFQEALEDPSAPTAEFFTFYDHPDEYESWLGVGSLPKLNYRSKKLRQMMYEGPKAVFRTWLRPPFSVDGWRLDVANMLGRQGADQLGMEVGQGIRRAVREENPQAYILGENFFDATSQLQGDCWDAVMNYSGFSKPLRYWLSGFQVRAHGMPAPAVSAAPWSTRAMVDSWQAFRASIPWEIARQQYNLLGSHDTERILSVVGGNPALNRLAAGILMTYPGVPGIYFGDEIGMGAGKYSEARSTMPWDRKEWDEDLLDFYQRLIHLRRSSPALIEGGLQIILVEENTVAYLRDAEDEQVIVIAHRGPGERPAAALDVAQGAVPDGKEFREIFSERTAAPAGGRLALAAMPPGIEIWRSVG
jgi:alpha-glucosidase